MQIARCNARWNVQTVNPRIHIGAATMSSNDEITQSENGLITILPVGLEDNELRMLKSLCMISSIAKGSRNRKYALANPGEGSHIYLVDAR
jgi:hypothetical protein